MPLLEERKRMLKCLAFVMYPILLVPVIRFSSFKGSSLLKLIDYMEDEMEKRPWKSGVFNYRYSKLKRSTRKVLHEFPDAEDVIRNQKQRFLSKSEDFGVDLSIADDDFEEMKNLLNR